MEIGDSRLLLVSNRLPVTVKSSRKGQWEFEASSGGLAAGLKGLAQHASFQWWGWPGIDVDDDDKAELERQLREQHGAVPVYVSSDLAQRHYNGFSSKLDAMIFRTVP